MYGLHRMENKLRSLQHATRAETSSFAKLFLTWSAEKLLEKYALCNTLLRISSFEHIKIYIPWLVLKSLGSAGPFG